MRTITAAQLGVLAAGVQGEHYRLSMKDGLGVWRDLTSYGGFNAVAGFSLQAKIADPHRTLDVQLKREMFKVSFAPGISASPLNRAYAAGGTVVPLIQLNREVKLEIAITPMDRQPLSSDWMEVFSGRVDNFDPAKGYELEFGCRASPSGRLAQQFIKTERVYSYAQDGTPLRAVACRIWDTQMTVAVGEYLVPASRGDADPGLNKFFKCRTGGVTGTTEPVWTTAANQADGAVVKWDYVGAPTTAGNPLEEILQGILDDSRGIGDGTVSLFTPTSPGWMIRQFLQERTHTLDALLALVHQIGWDLRPKWRESTGQSELTLYQPDRGSDIVEPVVLYTFGPSDYGDIETLAVDIATIRNNLRVIFPDRADLWPDGSPKRKVLEYKNQASIDKYGDLFSEIQEEEDSQIDSATEVDRMGTAFISDCCEPDAQMAVPLKRCFPWVEENDFYKFTANNLQHDTDLKLAVTSWSIELDDGKMKQKLQLRGRPTLGAQVQIDKTTHPKNPLKMKPHKLQQFQGTKTPSLFFTETVGGFKIVTESTKDKQALLDEVEIHISGTDGFLPDDTTLVGLNKGDITAHGDLDPGETYYGRAVPRYFNQSRLIRGQPSAQQSFVAGFLRPKHVNPEEFSLVGETPLNGSFEAYSRALGQAGPPDQWEMSAGVWLTDVRGGPLKSGAAAKEGARYLTWLATSGAYGVRSKYFQVIGGHVYELTAWVYRDTGDNDIEFVIEWNTDAKATTSPLTITIDTGDMVSSAWNQIRQVAAAPADAAYCRTYVRRAGATNNKFHVDAVKLKWLGEPWVDVVASGGSPLLPTFDNSWTQGKGSTTAAIRPENGRGWAKGSMGSGTVNVRAIQLPIGLFPPHTVRCPVMDGAGALREIEIIRGGALKLLAGNTSVVYLDHVSWPLS